MPDAGARRRWIAALQVALVVAAAAAIFVVLRTRAADLDQVRTLGLSTFLLVLLANLLAYPVGGVSLKLLSDRFGAKMSLLDATAVVIAGYTLNYLPMKSGTVLQGAVMRARHNVRIPHFVALSAASQLVSLAVSATVAGAALILAHGHAVLGLTLLVVPLPALGVLLAWGRRSEGNAGERSGGRIVLRLHAAADGLREIFADAPLLASLLAVNVTSALLLATRIFLLFRAFGTQVSFPAAVGVSAVGAVAYMFAPLPGGLGFREGGVAAGAALLAVPAAAALTVAVVDRGIDVLCVLIAGIPAVLYVSHSLRGVPSPEESEPAEEEAGA